MQNQRLILCLATLLFAFACLAAPAAAMMPTAIINVSASPIRIDRCLAGTRDTSVGNQGYYIDFAAAFTNRGPKTVSAVRLRFDIFNAFNEHLRTVFGTDDDGLLPASESRTDIEHNTRMETILQNDTRLSDADKITYLPTWEFINTTDTARSVVCSVDTVMFDDGAKWSMHPIGAKAFASALKRASAEAGTFYKSDRD